MLYRSFVTYDQAPAVIHPAKAAFDFPALAIPRARFDGAAALRLAPLAAFNGGDGRLDAPAAQALTDGLAVVRSVRHQFLRAGSWTTAPLRHAHRGQGSLHQLALVRSRTINVQADWQAVAIGHDHHRRALADFGLADAGPPFFAGTTLPSKHACAHSSLPWASSWLSKVRQICSQVPSAAQVRRRRQHVAGEPYVRGTSSQVQPVFSTKRMPLRVRRSSLRFRPGPACCSGIKGAITVHCVSVRSCRLMPTV
jgi:hypothetical protein